MSSDPGAVLTLAVRAGNLQEAKLLIDGIGLSYWEAWSGGYSLVRDALVIGHEDVAELLLKSGARVKREDMGFPQDTPLHNAVKRGYTKIVSMLLDLQADVNARDCFNKTPMDYAVEEGRSEIAKLLINRRGCSYEAVNSLCREKTPLHQAVQSGELGIAEELLKSGLDVNARYSEGWTRDYTALHLAVKQRSEEMVKLLVRRGADVNATGTDYVTPLHIGARKKLAKIVRLLLENGADVEICDKRGKTALRIAVEKGSLAVVEHILDFRPAVESEANRSSIYAAIEGPERKNLREIVEALLRYGFAVRAEDAEDAGLLHSAVERGLGKILEALLKLGADVNALRDRYNASTLLHSAVIRRRLEITELLLSHGANVNAENSSGKPAICLAIENNDAGIAKLLFNRGATVDVTTEMLHKAVMHGRRDIVEFLLQIAPKFDVDARDLLGRTPLHNAAINWHLECFSSLLPRRKKGDFSYARSEIAKILLSRGARVDAKMKDDRTALHAAVEGGYAKVVKILLENKADVEGSSAGEDYTTPLHLAATRGNGAMVKLLLDYGADVSARRKDGTTAIHIASLNDNEDVVKLLAAGGADLDAKDIDKLTPLHLVAKAGNSTMVDTLLKLGASIDEKDSMGRSALHFAARCGWPMVVKVLLDNGADFNVTCDDSQTPLDYAVQGIREDGNRNCVKVDEILKRHIVTIQAIDLWVSERNLRAIDLDHEHREILEDCQTEIAKMRSLKIGDSNVSLYDVLTGSLNQLAVCASNERIVQAFEFEILSNDFPIYFGIMDRRFEQGLKRQNLLIASSKSINALCGLILPYCCISGIFSYLSNEDLKNLVEADPGDDDCEKG